jgi:hypothetical protein
MTDDQTLNPNDERENAGRETAEMSKRSEGQQKRWERYYRAKQNVRAVTVHDHFDGCAHCVECGGPCQLTGPDRAYTELVRAVFENLAHNGLPKALYIRDTLEAAGVKFDHFLRRAEGGPKFDSDPQPAEEPRP